MQEEKRGRAAAMLVREARDLLQKEGENRRKPDISASFHGTFP
jgi:hypothetical protein